MSLLTLPTDLLIYLTSFLSDHLLVKFGGLNRRCRKLVQKRIDFFKFSSCLTLGNPQKAIHLDDLKIFQLFQSSHKFDNRLCYLWALYYNSESILDFLREYREKIDDVTLHLFFRKLDAYDEFHPRIFNFIAHVKKLKPEIVEMNFPIWVLYLLGKYSAEETKTHLENYLNNPSEDYVRGIIFFLDGDVLPSNYNHNLKIEKYCRRYLHIPFCQNALAKIGITPKERENVYLWSLQLRDESNRLLTPKIKQILKSQLSIEEKKQILTTLHPNNWIYLYSVKESLEKGYCSKLFSNKEDIFSATMLEAFERMRQPQYFDLLSYLQERYSSDFSSKRHILLEFTFKKKYSKLLHFLLSSDQNISLLGYLSILDVHKKLCRRVFRMLKVLAEARVPRLMEELISIKAFPIYLEYVRLLL